MKIEIGEGLTIVLFVAIFGAGIAYEEYTNAQRDISCNNLKAAAIAASQPVPKCAE